MFEKLKIIIVVAFFAIFAMPAFAYDSETNYDAKTVAKIEAYLNNLTTFTADFVQIDAAGMLSDGKFYLSRPGKFRWEYNPPVPIVITASAGFVNYYDTELKQANHVFLSSTPAGILADKKIELEKENIIEIKQQFGTTSINIQDDDDGNLTLVFADKPMLLESMVIQDSVGQKTNIIFSNQKTGMKLKKKLFLPLNPHEYNKPNRR